MLAGHSAELYLLAAGCTALIGLYGYLHARKFWEGLPPLLDAFVSMAGFAAILGAFVFGGRFGSDFGYPHAGRLLAVTIAVILYRTARTWIGKEQVRYRKIVVRKKREE
jgi:vacuolar-type H+-ATPase subunit I/STV1